MYKLSLTLRQHLIRFFFFEVLFANVFHNHVKESLQCIYLAETNQILLEQISKVFFDVA